MFGQPACVKKVVARVFTQALDVDSASMLEALASADHVYAPQETSDPFAILLGAELRPPAASPLEHGETKARQLKQRASIAHERRNDRHLLCGELVCKLVFFLNRSVAPAARTIELGNQRRARFDSYLVDTILVTIQRKDAAVTPLPERLDCLDDHVGRQSIVGMFGFEMQIWHSAGTVAKFASGHKRAGEVGKETYVTTLRYAASQIRCRLDTIAFESFMHWLFHGSQASMSILVTGGAGYIGSHVVRQLKARGENVIVLDNLSTGFRSAVLDAPLIVGDSGDRQLVGRILREHGIRTVMHFAAHTIVPESVSNPLKYYGNNTCSTRNLLQTCSEAELDYFVFSSTAAVYGIPDGGIAAEDSPTRPINPYGTSKLMSEWMLRDLAAASSLRYVVLRYFNVAGSDPGGRIGQSTVNGTLLTKVACETAVGKRPHVSIFGTDYPTKDGTGIRDYIHVEDLAGAHVNALEYLRKGGTSQTLNCGYGHGYSVREVISMVDRLNGAPIKTVEGPRRAGDPPSLVARADRVRQLLGWVPQYDNLETIVKSQLAWEKRLLAEPALQKNS